MSSGSNVTLSLSKVTIDSVEIIAMNQFASETGPVIVFDSDNTEVTRSSNITVSQNNVSVTIPGLDSYTEYTAKFYNNDSAMFSDSVVTFTTLGTNKIYGGVSGAGAREITDLYGGSNNGAQRITKLYGPVTTTIINTAVGTVREGGAGNVAALAGRGFVDKINTISLPSYALSYLGLRYDGAYFNLTLSFSDGTPTETLTGWVDESALLAWGIVLWPNTPSIGTDYIDLSITSSTSSKAKLIHQGFGHLDYT